MSLAKIVPIFRGSRRTTSQTDAWHWPNDPRRILDGKVEQLERGITVREAAPGLDDLRNDRCRLRPRGGVVHLAPLRLLPVLRPAGSPLS